MNRAQAAVTLLLAAIQLSACGMTGPGQDISGTWERHFDDPPPGIVVIESGGEGPINGHEDGQRFTGWYSHPEVTIKFEPNPNSGAIDEWVLAVNDAGDVMTGAFEITWPGGTSADGYVRLKKVRD